MNIRKKRMIEKAYEIHKEIYPCKGIESLFDCFTIESGDLYFWFNTKDKSTRLILENAA